MGNVSSIVQHAVGPSIPPCVACVAAHYSYVSQLKDNLQALKSTKDELEAKKTDVSDRISSETRRPHMKPLKQVELWVAKVDAAIREANQLIANGDREVQKLCIGGFCSWNVVSSYSVGKMVAKQLEDVNSILKTDLNKVVQRVPEVAVVGRPIDPTPGLDSMLDKAWSCLMEKEAGIIGIWGMGGVGKTTLLTKIENKLKEPPRDFEVVIRVVVSNRVLRDSSPEEKKIKQDLMLEKIQEEIGRKMGFSDEEWTKKSLYDKATDICNELGKRRFVLLLDDLWQSIDLSTLEIPRLDEKQSKIVLTTRSENVCAQMRAQMSAKIRAKCFLKVDPLDWEKAWELFRGILGEDALSANPDIHSLAQSVAKECAGLPLAIKTIARSMACKTSRVEWKCACDTLREQASRFEDLRDEVLFPLKHSFDDLPNDTYKSCFLYCSLFPEQYVIPKEKLIDYWICEDFWGEASRDMGYQIIGDLVRASLLEEEEESGEHYLKACVKMHDLIRDMAIWVACDDGKWKEKFLVQAGRRLKKAPKVKSWEGVKRLSLMANDIGELTEVPTCPNLLTLLLCNNFSLKRMSDGFFHSMNALTVLDLGWTEIEEVPLDISKLVLLQYLNLEGTQIRKLPREMKSLVNLKCLILECLKFLEIPRHLISSFQSLQVLRMMRSRAQVRDREDGPPSDGDAFVLEELEELLPMGHFSVLSIMIRCNASLGRISSNTELLHCFQELVLELEDCPESIEVSSLAAMERLISLQILGCERLQGITMMITSNPRSFESLTEVVVQRCPSLLDLTWLALAPRLKMLDVSQCGGIGKIIDQIKLGKVSGTQKPPFEELQWLRLWELPQLESIYGKALRFPSLKLIDVFCCPNLKRLPLDCDSARGYKISIVAEEGWWQELEWADDAAAKATFQFESRHPGKNEM